jgi:hypothetical protein
MGNWRTVNITGKVATADIDVLRKRLVESWDNYNDESDDETTCLSFDPKHPSLCGLNDWVRPTISANGNLAERDYSVEDVAETLRELVTIAPSLRLTVHCGDERESETCIATITMPNGVVTIEPPKVSTVTGVSDSTMRERLMWYLGN